MGSTSSPPDRRPSPAARTRGRRHLVTIGGVALLIAMVAGSGGSGGELDGIAVRLWVFLAVLVIGVLAVANGFDQRYPMASIGAVALRAVSVGSVVALASALLADPFVHGPADGGSPTATARVGAVLVAGVAGALWYGRRTSVPSTVGHPSHPSHPSHPGRRSGRAVGPLAVGLVTIPTVLGHLVVAFFVAYCGGGVASVLWLLVGLATPVTLWLAERAFHDRWPRAGVAVAVGRLVLVVLLQVAVLAVLTSASEGDAGCESTIGVDDAVGGDARISRAATGQ